MADTVPERASVLASEAAQSLPMSAERVVGSSNTRAMAAHPEAIFNRLYPPSSARITLGNESQSENRAN
jgi:hypothetical protein